MNYLSTSHHQSNQHNNQQYKTHPIYSSIWLVSPSTFLGHLSIYLQSVINETYFEQLATYAPSPCYILHTEYQEMFRSEVGANMIKYFIWLRLYMVMLLFTMGVEDLWTEALGSFNDRHCELKWYRLLHLLQDKIIPACLQQLYLRITELLFHFQPTFDRMRTLTCSSCIRI